MIERIDLLDSTYQHFTERVRFQQADATGALPFASDTFDALGCIDSMNHLPDRLGVLREWCRVLFVFQTVHDLTRERRLSRLAYIVDEPG